jgi:hypothetical protein
MKLDKKVTDFIKLEEGNIGRKSAVVTGAVLASSVLGTVLANVATVRAWDHCDVHCNHYQYHGNGIH